MGNHRRKTLRHVDRSTVGFGPRYWYVVKSTFRSRIARSRHRVGSRRDGPIETRTRIPRALIMHSRPSPRFSDCSWQVSKLMGKSVVFIPMPCGTIHNHPDVSSSLHDLAEEDRIAQPVGHVGHAAHARRAAGRDHSAKGPADWIWNTRDSRANSNIVPGRSIDDSERAVLSRVGGA